MTQRKHLKFALLISITCASLVGCSHQPSKQHPTALNEESRELLNKIKATSVTKHKEPDITPDSIQQALQEAPFHANLWDEMRLHYDLANQHYGEYDAYIAFYNKRKRHMEKISERAAPYLYYIFNEVKRREMPYEIALLPAVESGFRAQAKSSQQALGLWQFIPSTGDIFDLHRNWWYDGRKDVIKSTQAALDYLEKLYKLNNNDWLLALASYNSGLGNVYKAQKKYRKLHKNRPGIADSNPGFWQIKPFLPKETQGYVPKLLALAHIYEYQELFEINMTSIANEPFFEEVNIKQQVALHKAIELANTDKTLFKLLNPAYKQMATPPKGPHRLLIPMDSATAFKQNLANHPQLFNVQWQQHKIKRGDSLSVIAARYKASTHAIKQLNNLRSANIRAGKTLLIPIAVNNNRATNNLASAKTLVKKATHTTANEKHASKSQSNLSAATNNNAKQIYTVKAGDSLWKIAKQHQLSQLKIAQWNQINAKQPLKIGQKLILFSAKPPYLTHTVQRGESLWKVAQRYQVNTQQIAQWNNLKLKQILKPGTSLKIYQPNTNKVPLAARYIVKTGDNLSSIAANNKVSLNDLASHNNISKSSLLKPGQVLLIPDNS